MTTKKKKNEKERKDDGEKENGKEGEQEKKEKNKKNKEKEKEREEKENAKVKEREKKREREEEPQSKGMKKSQNIMDKVQSEISALLLFESRKDHYKTAFAMKMRGFSIVAMKTNVEKENKEKMKILLEQQGGKKWWEKQSVQ